MTQKKQATFYKPTYIEEEKKALEFLTGFTDQSLQTDPVHGKHKYMMEMVIYIPLCQQSISHNQSKRLEILVEDLESWFNDDPEFVQSVVSNCMSYIRVFSKVADTLLKDFPSHPEDEADLFDDVLNQQRLMNIERHDNEQNEFPAVNQTLPSEINRKQYRNKYIYLVFCTF